MRVSAFILLSLTLLGSSGCGYSLQNSHNPLKEKEGIERIFISPVINNTYKAGVENVVYNALVQNMVAHRRVILVRDPEQADAILQGTVSTANSTVSAVTSANSVSPVGLGNQYVTVAQAYTAQLSCEFRLTRRHLTAPKQKGVVWSAHFDRSKQIPAANQLDVYGTTSALINESELDRALSDMASSMMSDVHESMLAMFLRCPSLSRKSFSENSSKEPCGRFTGSTGKSV